MSRPWVLVIAGADSSGRAGIAADCDALAHFGVGVRYVVTVWSKQSAERVHGFSVLDAESWKRVALDHLAQGPAALKFGLLPGVAHVIAAAEITSLAMQRGIPVVLDPVLRSSSGFQFLSMPGQAMLRSRLLTQAIVVTPNLDEIRPLAGLPSGQAPRDREQREELARRVLARGARAVLLKGGHGHEDPVLDLILEQQLAGRWHSHARLPGRSMGGSGCRYASAVAGGLALGKPLWEAAVGAALYVRECLGRD